MPAVESQAHATQVANQQAHPRRVTDTDAVKLEPETADTIVAAVERRRLPEVLGHLATRQANAVVQLNLTATFVLTAAVNGPRWAASRT